MKKLLIILSLGLIIGCEVRKSSDQRLNELTPPIIVVGTGTSLGDCCTKVVDANGRFETIIGNSLCSVNKGDTLFGE